MKMNIKGNDNKGSNMNQRTLKALIPATLVLAGFILVFSVVAAQSMSVIDESTINISYRDTKLSGGETPPIPMSVYGTVLQNGSPAPVGVSVSTWCLGIQQVISYTYDVEGTTWYGSLDVPGDNGCSPGETVSFKVEGFPADQTALWTEGAYQVDLTYSADYPVYLPLVIR